MTATTRLGARAPFDSAGLLRFLALRAVPGVESVDDAVYTREGARVGFHDTGVDVTFTAGVDRATVTTRVTRLLDLDADPVAVGAALGPDPVLAPLVAATPGLRVPGAWSGFEVAVRAVVGQQVTLAAARTLLGRVVERCGGGGCFPEPEALAVADLDGLGMPGSRVRTLRAVAASVCDGDIDLDGGGDRAAVTATLLALPGIGPWTASYVAMRALGDPDAFPAGDVGLRNAAARLGLPTDPRALAAHAERWRPWRSYATVHLWRSLS